MATLVLLQKALPHQLLLLVAKISLTLTVRTLILNLSLKSHVTKFIQLLLLARSVTILQDGRQVLSGWSMMKTFKVLSVNTVKSGQGQATKLEVHGLLNHLVTGKSCSKNERTC